MTWIKKPAPGFEWLSSTGVLLDARVQPWEGVTAMLSPRSIDGPELGFGGTDDVVGGTDDDVGGTDDDVGGSVEDVDGTGDVVDDEVGEKLVEVGDASDVAGLHLELSTPPVHASAGVLWENAK